MSGLEYLLIGLVCIFSVLFIFECSSRVKKQKRIEELFNMYSSEMMEKQKVARAWILSVVPTEKVRPLTPEEAREVYISGDSLSQDIVFDLNEREVAVVRKIEDICKLPLCMGSKIYRLP